MSYLVSSHIYILAPKSSYHTSLTSLRDNNENLLLLSSVMTVYGLGVMSVIIGYALERERKCYCPSDCAPLLLTLLHSDT